MNLLSKTLALGAVALWMTSSGAQPAYPGKPIRLIVPAPAEARAMRRRAPSPKGMTASLGQEVMVENRPGGNSGIGAGAVLNSVPDGHTLLFALGPTWGCHLSKASPYKSVAEFTPVAAIGGNTQCLVVPASPPPKSLAEFVTYAKASPKPLMRGSEQRCRRHG